MLAGDRGQPAAATTATAGSGATSASAATIEVPMIFRPTVAAAEGAAVQPLQLLPGLEFHMYMSAQPCGALSSWRRLHPAPGCANPFAVFAGFVID